MANEPPERGLTRPPDDRDLVELARELNRLGVRYVVIGGVAINRLGFIRATEDIDLLIDRDQKNQILVKQALEILPDKAVRELGDEDLSEAEPYIELETIEGVQIPFASAALMLRFKQGMREKDIMDRRFLEERRRGKDG